MRHRHLVVVNKMSNHNLFWGKRFGYITKGGDTALVVKQMSVGASNSGPHQVSMDPRSPVAIEAKRQREEYALAPRRAITVQL